MPNVFDSLFFPKTFPLSSPGCRGFLNPVTVLSATPQSAIIQVFEHSEPRCAGYRIDKGNPRKTVSGLGALALLFLACLLSIPLFPSSPWAAGPTFLNRQGFPVHLVVPEIGRFLKNDLKTFEVWTQWSNPTHQKIAVTVNFIFFDRDAADSQFGEDGEDDRLMTVTETFTIPEQVNNWGKYFQLTAIGHKLNQGFDHPEEGNVLELFIDAQIVSIQHLSAN